MVSGSPMHLHTNVYSAAVTHDGAADCESGQRGYMRKLTTYDKDENTRIVTDPHIPGRLGTHVDRPPRVPEGQTFDRLPTMGPAMPKELDK